MADSYGLISSFSVPQNLKRLFVRPAGQLAPLDAFRAISILLIFVFHCFFSMQEVVSGPYYYRFYENTPAFLGWIWGGDRGVDIFFVLSGFLIGGILFREYDQQGRIRFGRFYWRRFLRLAPVYFLAMGIYWFAGGDNTHNLWANLLYVNNFLSVLDMAMMWCWSLAVEEQFYLILPVLILLFSRMRVGVFYWCLGLFILSFVIRAWIYLSDDTLQSARSWQYFFDNPVFRHYFETLYDNLYTRFGSLVCGVYGAYLHCFKADSLSRYFKGRLGQVSFWLAILVVVLFTMYSSDLYSRKLDWVDNSLFRNIYIVGQRNLYSAAILILMLSSLYPSGKVMGGLKIFLSSRFWYPIAQLSYSIYIFHLFAIFVFFKTFVVRSDYADIVSGVFYYGKFAWLSVLAFVVTIIFSIVVYILVERPFMNLRHFKRGGQI